MKIVSFSKDGKPGIGAVTPDGVVDLAESFLQMQGMGKGSIESVPRDVIELLERDPDLSDAKSALDFARERLSGGNDPSLERLAVDLNDVSIEPPVRRPLKVIGVGMNFYSFCRGINEEPPSYPTLFHKTASALVGCFNPIVIPDVTEQVVPEGELAVVIGHRAKNVSEADAKKYIAGYACANDICARDLEFRTSQWTSGKMLDTFCPLGPHLVTPDELDDAQALPVTTRLNGRVIQSGNTSDMIFSIPMLIREITSLVTLEPGDVILTGTPSDLGALSEPIMLTPGDRISVEVEGIGMLENPVVKEKKG